MGRNPREYRVITAASTDEMKGEVDRLLNHTEGLVGHEFVGGIQVLPNGTCHQAVLLHFQE